MSDGTAAGSVYLTLRLDDSRLDSEIRALSGRVSEIEFNPFQKALEGFSESFNKTLEGVTASIEALNENIMRKFQDMGDSIGKAIGEGAKAGANALNDIRPKAMAAKIGAPDYKKELQSAGEQVDALDSKVDDLGNNQAFPRLSGQASALSGRLRDVTDGFREASSSMGGGFSQAGDMISSLISKAGALFLITKVITGIGKAIGGVISKVWDLIKKINRALINVSLGALSILGKAARTIFSLLARGFKEARAQIMNAARQFPDFGAKLNSVHRSIAMLKGAFASVAMPLINIAMPIVERFASAITSVFNSIATWIARLTGQKSVLLAVGGLSVQDVRTMNATARATDKATKKKQEQAKANEELKRSLAGFDELTILSFGKAVQEDLGLDADAEDLSGGSVGSGLNNRAQDRALFKRQAVEPLIGDNFKNFGKEIAEKINASILKIRSEEIGDAIRGKIQKGIDFAYGFFNELKFNRFGERAATLLNHTFKKIDGFTLGGTIAQALNTAFYTLSDFVHNFDWKDLGKQIADTITGFFEDWDPEESAEALRGFINGLLDTAQEIIEETDWQKVMDKVAAFLNTLNWPELMGRVGDVLKEAIGILAGVVWGHFKESMAGEYRKAFTNLGRAMQGHPNDDLERAQMNAFMGLFNGNKRQTSRSYGGGKGKSFNSVTWGAPASTKKASGARSIGGISKYARGGIVDQPQIALIGEAGREAVMPLENNTGWIKELAGSIAQMNGGGGAQNVTIPVYLGTDTLLDVIKTSINRDSRLRNQAAFDM